MNSSKRIMIIGDILALVIVILYIVSYQCTEWFPGANQLFMVAVTLAESFIAASLFYYVLEYLPYKRRKKIALGSEEIALYRIYSSMSQLLLILLSAAGVQLEYIDGRVHVKDIDSIDNVNEFDFKRNSGIATLFVGHKLEVLGNLEPLKLCTLQVESINSNISRLKTVYEFFEYSLVDILEAIEYSDLLETIKHCPTETIFSMYINSRFLEVKRMYEFYNKLIGILEKQNYTMDFEELKQKYAVTN